MRKGRLWFAGPLGFLLRRYVFPTILSVRHLRTFPQATASCSTVSFDVQRLKNVFLRFSFEEWDAMPHCLVGCTIPLKYMLHYNVIRERWDTVPPTQKSHLFSLRHITISLWLDSSGLSLWNVILAYALQIYLLFYLPSPAHGKIIPNTCHTYLEF